MRGTPRLGLSLFWSEAALSPPGHAPTGNREGQEVHRFVSNARRSELPELQWMSALVAAPESFEPIAEEVKARGRRLANNIHAILIPIYMPACAEFTL